MDEIDRDLISALRRNARMSVSELSAELGLARATVRSRMDRLIRDEVILGFSIVLKEDVQQSPVRGLMSLSIEGRGADRITRQLNGMPAVRAVHSTNGKWDLIAEIGTETLEDLDLVLADIRRLDGVMSSETSLLLSTKKDS